LSHDLFGALYDEATRLRICDLKTLTIRDFVDGLLKFAKVVNAKDDTINIVKDIASKIF